MSFIIISDVRRPLLLETLSDTVEQGCVLVEQPFELGLFRRR